MSQYDPFYRALADLQFWAKVLGCEISAIAVTNIPEPKLPDWEAERSRYMNKEQ